MPGNDRQDPEVALLEDISDSLRELLTWTRATGHAAVKLTLETVLDTGDKRSVYHLMDGQRGVTEIQKLTGVNVRYVSEWGQEWERIGIALPSRISGIKGRREHAFDLKDFGIELPQLGHHED
jgi:hypothetical protein